MFTYFLARGVNQGTLDSSYADAARRGYAGLVSNFFAIESDGTVSLTGICEVAGLGFGRDGSWDYYMGTPIVTNDEKGLGPALLAGLEVARLVQTIP
jgi:rhamnogalacturonyl hydrolase YesR